MSTDEADDGHQDFFFYGTLCHPGILKRVLGHDCQGITYQDALLPNYTRHHVKGEDYPAVVGDTQSQELLKGQKVRDIDTRGTLVRGLSYQDMLSLDIFEGDQYSRARLPIRPLTAPRHTFTLPMHTSDNGSDGDKASSSDNSTAEKCSACKGPAHQPPSAPRRGGMGYEGTVLEHREEAERLKVAKSASPAKRDSVLESESDEDWDSARRSIVGDETPKSRAGEAGSVALDEQEAWVYVWSDKLELLEPNIWDFDQFVKDKAHVWLSASTTEYDEVEQNRSSAPEGGLTGTAPIESPSVMHNAEALNHSKQDDAIESQVLEGFPEFGKGMLKYWNFREGYVNLNHGSYGSPPKAVVAEMRRPSDRIEACPDLYMRRTYIPELDKVRDQVAALIGADRDEVVLTPNATHAINNVVREMKWEEGDIIVMYNTTYGAIGQTLKYICDKHPGVSLHVIDLTFPIAHAEIVAKTEEVFAKYNQVAKPNYSGISKPTPICQADCTRVKMCVVDQIASVPGVIFPWEDITRLCKKYGVLSMGDAADAIGHVKTDIKASDPDFWVSNCHKWLHSHRGCAVLYVPIRNQILIRSSMPTSADYESAKYPSPSGRHWQWAKQYVWTGTQDWTPYMTIPAAIEFRKSIGGEDRIMTYCHSLAVHGGKKLAKRWGTVVMENPEGDLTAAMVNVALPDVREPKDLEETFKQLKFFEDGMFENNCFAPPLYHGGRWWTRCSAQVWNDLSDFDYLGDVYEKLCKQLREGKLEHFEVSPLDTVSQAADLPTHDE